MPTKDKRVDAYIAKSAGFAKPIMNHLRALVHKACTEVEETWRWSFPNFDYKGTLCTMAAFKEHCSFGFWKASLMKDPNKLFPKGMKEGMGHLGMIKSLKDLPSDKILIAYIKEAAVLNDKGVKLPPKSKPPEKKELIVPDEFMNALRKNKKALKTYDDFSYTNKKEYISWITEAKTDETRISRIATAIEWMGEGKIRNWKYLRK